MSGYTDTILIDCNRESSSEAKDPDNKNFSTFTCGVSDGLKLNVGDVVSVHSGFVSQRGCGDPNQIELTGKDLEYEYTVEETQMSIFQRYDTPFENQGNETPNLPDGSCGVTNSRYFGYKQVSVPKTLKDNEMSLSVTYYKTSNGEGYFNLPRRFDAKKGSETEGFDWNANPYKKDGAGAPSGSRTWREDVFGAGTLGKYGPEDCYSYGRTMGLTATDFQRCNADTDYYKWGQTPLTETGRNPDQIKPDTSRLFKYKNANERFTLMVLTDNYYGRPSQFGAYGYIEPDILNIQSIPLGDAVNQANTGLNRDTFTVQTGVGATRQAKDPCLQEWIIYKEVKDIVLPLGFQSPESMAASITEQLQERSDFKSVLGAVGGLMGKIPAAKAPFNFTNMEQSVVTSYADSECYKTFPSASAYEFTSPSYIAWRTDNKVTYPAASLGDAENNYKQISYMNSYSTIGVKRPELWEAGRNIIKSASMISAGEYDVEADGNIWYPLGDSAITATNKSWRNYQPGFMLNQISYADRFSKVNDTTLIQTSYRWNAANLELFRKWFDLQGKDESLFKSSASNIEKLGTEDKYFNQFLSSNNARYIHMNVADVKVNVAADIMKGLGDDNYETEILSHASTGVLKLYTSAPLWIGYDPTRATIYHGGEDENSMWGGFAQMRTITTGDPENDGDDADYEVICFNTSLIGGINTEFWTSISGEPTPATPGYFLGGDGTNTPISPTRYTTPRRLGVDPHFNGYGNHSMCLYAGFLTSDENDDALYADVDASKPPILNGDSLNTDHPWWIGQYIKQRYVGASSPTLSYDETLNKYAWSSLHTPEYTGNVFDAGKDQEDPSKGQTNLINPGAGDPVWFLNKRTKQTEFCPDMMPYGPAAGIKVSGGTQTLDPFNYNLELGTIFDADGGIFIDSFNIPENLWQQSLMGILGFTWAQFNGGTEKNTRQFRLNDNIIQDPSGSLTTNAIVNGADIIQLRTNIFGANYYNGQLPIQFVTWEKIAAVGPAPEHYDWRACPYVPVVSEEQSSASITSENLPRKMLTPYYIIRSDLINDTNYNTGHSGRSLPIIYVVNKENGFGDFFFQNTSETSFTVTKEKIITSVTTSIHNPDMTTARMSEGSGIIYKIIKNNPADMNVASEILNKNKGKK